MWNYHNRVFRALHNSDNGEVSEATRFYYQQHEHIVTASYAGGGILSGHLIAQVDAKGQLDMRYHHINEAGVLQTGICCSVPELLPDGRIRLYETWQWTSGDGSTGTSVIEEI